MPDAVPTGYQSVMSQWFPYQGRHGGLPLMFRNIGEVLAWCRMSGVTAENADIHHIISDSQKIQVSYRP